MKKLEHILRQHGFIIACTMLLVSWPTRVDAITWCHDYVYFVISGGKDSNNIQAKQLRETELPSRGYFLVKTLLPGTVNESSFLKKGDVLIFNDSHSGVVVDNAGHIDHFLQKFGSTNLTNKEFVTYTPKEALTEYDFRLKSPLLRRSWTLDQIRKFTYNIASAKSAQGSFINAKVEIWRPIVNMAVQVLDKNTEKGLAGAEVRIRSISANAEVVVVLTDASGKTGTLEIRGDKVLKGLQIRATSKDYKERWSDVSPDLLTKGEEQTIPVYLQPLMDSRLFKKWRKESKFGFEEVVFRPDGTATYIFHQIPPYPLDLNFTTTFKILSNSPETGLWIELWDPTHTHRRVFRFFDGNLEFPTFG